MAAPVSSTVFSPRERQEPTLPSPSFYRAVYAEIEEVGWERLLRAEEDLSCVSFRVPDKKGRIHILEISFSLDYPESSPTIAADAPCICEVVWSKNSRLKDVLQQFSEHLQNMQEFWSTMDEIDRALCVVNPTESSLATSYRQIELGNDCYLLLHISCSSPRSLPECRFFGADLPVDSMRNNWKKNAVKWRSDKPFVQNLATLLERELPSPSVSIKDDTQTMNSEIIVEMYQTIPARILVAENLFTVSASEIGCIQLQQQGSRLTFCSEIAPIVLNQLQSKLTTDITGGS